MKASKTILKDCYLIEPECHGDNRGWFMETYSKRDFDKAIGKEIIFVQDNQSFSKVKGVFRGMHCQKDPHSQSKLIRCTRGAIIDIVLDLRSSSPTYLQSIKVELSASNMKQLFIPKGFLHGFCTLTYDVEIKYKVDDFYDKETDRSVNLHDPVLGLKL